MNNGSDFLTSIIGYISTTGSQDDPKGKEGLHYAVSKTYDYGTKKYSDSNRLFNELEKLGAQFSQFTGKQETGLVIRVPKENLSRAEYLLDEIINNPIISAADAKKVIQSQLMDIKDVETDDMNHAVNWLTKLVLNEENEIGTESSVKTIKLNDLISGQKEISQNFLSLKVDGAENFHFDKKSVKFPVRKNNSSGKVKYKFIEKDLEQKVLCLGYRTGGFNDYKFAVRLVAQKIIYNGLGGMIPKAVRTDNDAAYYAYGLMTLQKEKGMYYACAGVSEESVVKVIKLIQNVVTNLINGDFDKARFEEAKKSALGEVEQLYDSISKLFSFYSTRILMESPIPNYQELTTQIAGVSFEDTIKFYNEVFKDNEVFLTINGKLKDETMQECLKLIGK